MTDSFALPNHPSFSLSSLFRFSFIKHQKLFSTTLRRGIPLQPGYNHETFPWGEFLAPLPKKSKKNRKIRKILCDREIRERGSGFFSGRIFRNGARASGRWHRQLRTPGHIRIRMSRPDFCLSGPDYSGDTGVDLSLRFF